MSWHHTLPTIISLTNTPLVYRHLAGVSGSFWENCWHKITNKWWSFLLFCRKSDLNRLKVLFVTAQKYLCTRKGMWGAEFYVVWNKTLKQVWKNHIYQYFLTLYGYMERKSSCNMLSILLVGSVIPIAAEEGNSIDREINCPFAKKKQSIPVYV